MKTLDEVIKAWSICFSDNSRSNCTGCPYADDDGEAACFNHDREDALHYLKELRDMTDIPMEYFENGGTSQKVRNTSQITCPKCHSEFAILDDPDGDHQQLLKCQALLQDFYRNEPLTWDELKTMEGKPVWVESSDSLNRRRWMFVGEWFDDDEMRLFDMECDYPDYVSKNGYESGTWQAYRKERE